MIEEIRELAAPAFRPCTHCFDVSEAIDGADLVILNLEGKAPQLIFEDRARSRESHADGAVIVREATEAELYAVLQWLQANPPHPESLSPSECLERFTDAEQDAIDRHYPRYGRQLFAATTDIPWGKYAEAVEALTTAGVLSEESRTRHVGPRK